MVNKVAHNNHLLAILIVSIMPICGLGIDIYTPSLPVIIHLLDAPQALGKLTISLYILGFGLGQLFVGPLSDQFGRKIVLMTSLLVFALASTLVFFATNIHILLLIRLLQGLAVAGQVLNVRAIAADSYTGLQLRTVSVYITTAWTMSPIIGPFIGGYFQTYSGWHASFYFLACYSMLLFLCVGLFLSESNHQRQSLTMKSLLSNYRVVALDWPYMKNVLGLTLGFTVINTFNVLGPFIIQEQLHHTPLYYAHLTLIIGCACFLGSVANRFVINKVKQDSVIYICILTILIVSLISFLLVLEFQTTVAMVVVPVAIIIFAAGAVYPNFSANCSSLFKSIAGTAAALRGVTTMVGAAVLTAAMSMLSVHHLLAFYLIYAVLSFCMLMVFLDKIKVLSIAWR